VGLLGLTACGIDAVGAFAGDGGASVPPGGDVEGGVFVPPPGDGGLAGGGEASVGVEGGVVASIAWSVVENPGAIDLTAQGTLDWAHWGDHADGTPVRKATGGARIGQFVLTNAACDDNQGPAWTVTASWMDGTAPDSTSPPTDLHRRVYGKNGTTISVKVACDGASHVLGIDLGGWSASARFEAGFDNIVTTPAIADDRGNNGGYFAERYTVTYTCPVGTNLVVSWVATNLPQATVCSGSDMILSSATLR
jgi:hypothetical protein